MRLVSDRDETLAIVKEFGERGVGLFAPNAESIAEIEGLCMGAQSFAEQHGLKQIPIIVNVTGVYPDCPQLLKLSPAGRISDDATTLSGGDLEAGCELWMRFLEACADLRGYWPSVVVMPSLDHGWTAGEQTDEAILTNTEFLERFALVTFDASYFDMEENVERTAHYVSEFGSYVVVEGICDKIYPPAEVKRLGLSWEDQLSKPDVVADYVKRTNVDLVVPNIGTEHRSVAAGAAKRQYSAEVARQIKERCGSIISLHGSSCLGDGVGGAAKDGIVKVNYYSAMATGAGNRTYELLRANEEKVMVTRDLWMNSPTFFEDVRRRSVSDLCVKMLGLLGYDELAG